MPKVTYDRRIMLDADFLRWLKQIKQTDGRKFHDATKQLLHIKASSAEHRKRHNVILKSDYEALINEGLYNPEPLKGLAKPINKPDFISTSDGIATIVRVATFLANDEPYRTVIFTSPNKVPEYEANPHFQKMHSITVKGGEEALNTLKYVFRQYENAKL